MKHKCEYAVSQRPGDEAAGRLTALDIEEYGRAIVIAEGARGRSYYSDLPTIPLSTKISIENRIALEAKFQSALQGGHLNLICIAPGTTSRALFKLTQYSYETGCKFQTYTSNYTSCSICNQTSPGIIPRCRDVARIGSCTRGGRLTKFYPSTCGLKRNKGTPTIERCMNSRPKTQQLSA